MKVDFVKRDVDVICLAGNKCFYWICFPKIDIYVFCYLFIDMDAIGLFLSKRKKESIVTVVKLQSYVVLAENIQNPRSVYIFKEKVPRDCAGAKQEKS